MKTLLLLFVVAGVPACGQQLVEFGQADQSVVDLGNGRDFSVGIDLSSDLSLDLSVGSDLARDLLASDGAISDAFPPSRLLSCADKLGTVAQSFAVLGGVTVSNTGLTTVVGGNIGVSPGNAVTGIPPGMPIGGSIHSGDAVAAQAQSDLTDVYTCTQATACDQMLTGTDLGGLTLGPGVYCFTSSAALTGTLVLDANGDPDAIWFFKVASALDITTNSRVHVIGGGQDCRVFWQVGSSVTLGVGSRTVGNLLSMASITAKTGASISGRALARSGAVTLDTNDIAVPSCR